VSGLIAAFKNKYGLSGQRFSEEEQTPEEQKGPGENLTLPFESVWRLPAEALTAKAESRIPS
jgi:hypothetical protein